MSLYTKVSKDQKNNHNNSKTTYMMLEQERNLLKITLDYVVKENEALKQQAEDMKITVKHNKELLKEYIEKITNKDKVVEKMNSTIEQLTQRLHSLEEYIKNMKNKGNINPLVVPNPIQNQNTNNLNNLNTVRNQNINFNVNIATQSNPSATYTNGEVIDIADHNFNNIENNVNMLPSSPNRRHNNLNNLQTGSEFNPTNNNINIGNPVSSNNNNRQNFDLNLQNKNLNLNLNNLIKNNEQYEMNLAINSTLNAHSLNNNIGHKDYYSQTQRSSMQNPMVLNPEQFNNMNNKSSKLADLTYGNKNISNEKLKDELNMIKDDLQFILENKSKAKLKERLETSFSNIYTESDLNNSIISTQSIGKVKSKYNLKEKMDNANLTKFQEFLNTYNHNKNILLLVDSKNTIWELVKRSDLNINNISTMDNITSLVSISYNKDENSENANKNNLPDDKLLNIEIKDYEDKSFINSDMDISKVTDFNISALIRDTQNNDASDIN